MFIPRRAWRAVGWNGFHRERWKKSRAMQVEGFAEEGHQPACRVFQCLLDDGWETGAGVSVRRDGREAVRPNGEPSAKADGKRCAQFLTGPAEETCVRCSAPHGPLRESLNNPAESL
ncbi:hypothetical protein [Nocardiopsis composta]|uniref:Uncharacterized protein n=1 Tax=Nocardiopsis composta TaxID=157465 RepID=A0A7W8VC13_9ACTN|nr:hypothetical protein [Nocardiopsis composta]MBB5430448.1 hypothetical protein [Nocardiopsis composta]